MNREEVKDFVRNAFKTFKELTKSGPLIDALKGSLRSGKLETIEKTAEKALKNPNFYTSLFGAKIIINVDVIKEDEDTNYRIMLFVHKKEPTNYIFIDEGKSKYIIAIPFQEFASEVLDKVRATLHIKGDNVKEGLIKKDKDLLVFYGGKGEFWPADHIKVADLLNRLGIPSKGKRVKDNLLKRNI